MSTDLDRYLELLAGRKPGGRLLEIRSRWDRPGLRRRFFDAETQRPEAVAHIRTVGEHVDMYVGVLLRHRVDEQAGRRAGGKAAVSDSHLLFVEIDSDDAYRQLLQAPEPPSAVVSSGTPGHLHAYFLLEQPVDVAACESGNRRLAAAVGGDPQSVDGARLLRPPTTLNHKREPTPVRLELLDPSRCYDYWQLVGGVADPKMQQERASVPRHPRGVRAQDGEVTERLRSIPTAEYVEALTGQVPNIDGKVRCPFHGAGQERTPSLHCFGDGCWQCFGCGKGGTIFHFAGYLYGITPNGRPRGRDFLLIKDELAQRLGNSTPPAPAPGRAALQTRQRPPAAIVHPTTGAAVSGTER